MNQEIMSILREMEGFYCEGCDLKKECKKDYNYDCATRQLMNRITALEFDTNSYEDEGCFICDSGKDIFFDDGRGGFRVADYCPNCGKKLN